jgi:hypothetical protein
MNNEDKLKDFLQTSFSGYNHPVKNDWWSALEKELPQRNSVFRKRYRIAASVAAVLILAFGLFFLFQKQNEHEHEIFVLEENTIKEEFIKPEIINQKTTTRSKKNVWVSNETRPADTVFYAETNSEISAEIQQETDKNEDISPPKNKIYLDDKLYAQEPIPTLVCCSNEKNLQLSLAGNNFFAMNNSLNLNEISKDSHLRSYTNNSNIGSNVANQAPSNDELTHIDYQLPINLSLLVRKNLSRKWSVETGLSYTYLASKETWYSAEYKMSVNHDIGLHYLGIPLKASYTFYDNRQWSVYLAGGGMLEKCISGEIQTKENANGIKIKTKLDIPELQFSLMGNAGITYRITGPLGLFIEPGFSYFFDDKSEVMTIRKGKPLTFNLQGGLRFDF